MRKIHLLPAILFCAYCGMLLMGCNSKTETTSPPPPKPILDPIREGNDAKKPGDYCFSWKESNASSEGRLNYSDKGIATGTLRGTIVDASNGSEAISNTSFTGSMRGDTLYLDVTSDDTGSRVSQAEKWVWKGSTLVQGSKTFQEVTCR